MNPRFLAPLIALILSLAFSGVAAPINPLSLAPGDSEFVASVNFRQIADSPVGQRLLREKGGEQAQALLQVVQNLTGVDLRKDLDRAVLWGRIEEDDSVGAVFQGRFDQEKLLALLRINPQYKETSSQGLKTYEWFDEKEKRTKYGAFLADGSILIVNHPRVFEAALGAQAAGNGFLAGPKASLLPEKHEDLAAWGLLMRPERALPGGKMKDTLHVQSAILALSLEPSAVHLRFRVNLDSAGAVREWQDLMRGALALGRLQQENPGARNLAESGQVNPVEGRDAVALDLKLTTDELLGLMGAKGQVR